VVPNHFSGQHRLFILRYYDLQPRSGINGNYIFIPDLIGRLNADGLSEVVLGVHLRLPGDFLGRYDAGKLHPEPNMAVKGDIMMFE